ncbi:MAG: hypothetical protein Q9174_005532 [Haloplaca sp. 1 TL-2023]
MSTNSGLDQPHAEYVTDILGIKISDRDPDTKWDVSIYEDAISSIEPHDPQSFSRPSNPQVLDGRNCLLAPSLCHPHIHLDKCFLLNDPKYADLVIENGDFAEALSLTSQAKSRFDHDDLLRRGGWLIEESISAGVTHMRAFVEVDATVQFKCLEAGLVLKDRYRQACHVQICVFAQDPLFSGENAAENKRLMGDAVQRRGVEVIGSTPYVEADKDRARKNIEWTIIRAKLFGKHLDFHLDYNLDASQDRMVDFVIGKLHGLNWTLVMKHWTIVLGHCTGLTQFCAGQWHALRERIGELPVSFVGLPTSDLFMMGRPDESEGGGDRPRGTLQIPQMIEKYHLDAAIGVNNVGNAFTPQGSCDPLSLASMGVGIYQAGTRQAMEILYECVSERAKVAIGCGLRTDLSLSEGDEADLVLFEMPNPKSGRQCGTLQQVVCDPPAKRSVVFQGRLVSA